MFKDLEAKVQVKILEAKLEHQTELHVAEKSHQDELMSMERSNRAKETEIKVEKARLEEKRANLELTNQLKEKEATVEQLTARIEESPYKQVELLMKAILVKLPTLDIKNISINQKGK